MAQGQLWGLVPSRGAISPANSVPGGDGQAAGPLPAGVAEGSGQVLHRENRLPAPGGVGAVNTVPVTVTGITSKEVWNEKVTSLN